MNFLRLRRNGMPGVLNGGRISWKIRVKSKENAAYPWSLPVSHRLFPVAAALALSVGLSACTPPQAINNTAGKASVYNDVQAVAPGVAGVGIESQDIVSATDQMMRDMLTNPVLAGQSTPPRVIVDSQYFVNESTSRINTNSITDRLRVNLNRASNGRMVFVARQNVAMIEAERELKREGKVDGGTIRKTKATAGADYRLAGRITSMDAVSTSSGTNTRYTQITFEMIDLELGTIVWSGIYEFKKSSQDDVVYR